MNWEVFVTCAVTGVGDTVGRSDRVPVTPDQIADAALEAAQAGAAVAHIHVRDPATGRGSRDPRLYREVVERIRASDTDVVINLTAGMGGDTARARRGAAAGDLHARLRLDELRRGGRLRAREHAADPARNGATRP